MTAQTIELVAGQRLQWRSGAREQLQLLDGQGRLELLEWINDEPRLTVAQLGPGTDRLLPPGVWLTLVAQQGCRVVIRRRESVGWWRPLAQWLGLQRRWRCGAGRSVRAARR